MLPSRWAVADAKDALHVEHERALPRWRCVVNAIEAGWLWRRSRSGTVTAIANPFSRIEAGQRIEIPLTFEGITVLLVIDLSNWPELVNIRFA